MKGIAEIFARWTGKPRLPENYNWYGQACADSALLKTKISEIRFVVVDTETTGLNPRKDQILSIGAVSVQNFAVRVGDSFDAHLKQQYFNNDSIAVHEITPGKSANAQDAGDVMVQFLEYLRGSVFIAHYAHFDYQIISQLLKKHQGFGLQNQIYDTMWLLPRIDDHFRHPDLVKPGEFGLESLCMRYHIPQSDLHTALGDAFATALLFARLLKKLELRGVNTLQDLLRR